MMSRHTLGAVLALLSVAAHAESSTAPQPHGDATLYWANGRLDYGGGRDVDGDGYGMRLWLGSKIGFFTGQIEQVELDGAVADLDVRDLRAGMGWRFLDRDRGALWVRAEYVAIDSDTEVGAAGSVVGDEDGYALHLGGRFDAGILDAYAEGGFLDTDASSGPEFTLGLSLQPGPFGAFAEYRLAALDADDADVDFDYEVLRVGVKLSY